MKITAVIQSSLGSVRLPNKALLCLPYNSDTTILGRVISRVRKSCVDEVVLAVTNSFEDERLVHLAKDSGIAHHRGTKKQLLSQFCEIDGDIIVRFTGDCPCTDPDIIDHTISEHINSGADYTCNRHDKYDDFKIPDGFDVEVVNAKSLRKAENTIKYCQEHVTAYLYMPHEPFKVHHVPFETTLRTKLSVDTRQDYALICALYDLLPKDFRIKDIEDCFKKHPWLELINKGG